MAAYQKFNSFTAAMLRGVHNFDAHTFKAMLSNVAPVSTNAVKSDLTEIAAGNGYAAGGVTVSTSVQSSGGTSRVIATDATITAAGGSIPTSRFVIVYNDTAANKPLVGFIDRGSSTTIEAGQTMTIDFNDSAGLLGIT